MSKEITTNITLKNLNDYQLNKILKICNEEIISYSMEKINNDNSADNFLRNPFIIQSSNSNVVNNNNDKAGYWCGPYDCLIPDSCNSCVAGDGGNTRYKRGSETEMHVTPSLTKKQWLEQFAVFDEDEKQYYYVSR